MSVWDDNPAMDVRLAALRLEGLSFADIARRLGVEFSISVTRNPALGRAYRQGMRRGAKPDKHAYRKAPATRKSKYRAPLIAAVPNPTPLLDAKPGQCRWIDGQDTMICGAEIIPGLSWCSTHAPIVFSPKKVAA